MSVPQRTQYLASGGGRIGPTAPGTAATGAAYAPGGATGTYGKGEAAPGAGDGGPAAFRDGSEGGATAPPVASACGNV